MPSQRSRGNWAPLICTTAEISLGVGPGNVIVHIVIANGHELLHGFAWSVEVIFTGLVIKNGSIATDSLCLMIYTDESNLSCSYKKIICPTSV